MNNKVRIKLNFDNYKDKVHACWIGKNIGGTMGTPYEGIRKTHDIQGFSTKPGKPLPNDDLDLQLIWLHAVEQMGPLAINAATLGEFWVSLLPPNWNEYGIGKNNIRRGLVPPISGDYNNSWKNSNGAWIRTEIWASMAPGCPDIAARYAMEDGKVDHGAGEGTVAAAFVAAMQSAAFVIKDLRECIEIGLAAIPEKSRMADSIRFVLECYDKKMDAMDARNAVFERNSDIGDGWFEAPSNVSYAVIGLLWGGGDFKKSMIIAINCGDDTDCTGATVGATLGISGGMDIIPKDWSEHVGDDIITVSINRADGGTGGSVPTTCTELTERVVAQAPFMLFANHAQTALVKEEESIPENAEKILRSASERMRNATRFEPFSAHFESSVLRADLFIDKTVDIEANEEKNITVWVSVNRALGDELINLTCRWWLPEGFSVIKGKKTAVISNKNAHHEALTPLYFTLKAGESVEAVNRAVLEIMPVGRASALYVPITFLG